MLVLTRHTGETVRVGDNIIVTIIEVRGDKVRLGFHAPSDVDVHRQEIYEIVLGEQGRTDELSHVVAKMQDIDNAKKEQKGLASSAHQTSIAKFVASKAKE